MAEQKITRKQMFQHIAEVMADDEVVVEFCKHNIELIEKQAARPRKTKVNEEMVAFRNEVATYLEGVEDAVTAKEVAEAMSERLGMGISVQKASAALRFLTSDGRAVSFDNGSKAKTYAASSAETDAEEF